MCQGIDEAIFRTGNGSRHLATSRDLRKLPKTGEGHMPCSGLGTSHRRKLQQGRGVRGEPGGLQARQVKQAVEM